MKRVRNPDSAPGNWYIDTECIDCGAACHVALGLIEERNGKSVFVRQPETPEDVLAAWRAVLVCPTASVRNEAGSSRPPAEIFPEAITDNVWRCGFNARSSFGAHSYFVTTSGANVLVDSPRYASELVTWFDRHGGIAHILLSHQDDVAGADKFAKRFGARVWIHRDDSHAAPYASDFIVGDAVREVVPGLVAIPVPGHTRGSVVFLLDNRILFTGDSLAWSMRKQDLVAFRDACWYSWDALTASLAKLVDYRFEWVLPGHGWSAHLDAREMQARLHALVGRMRES